MIDMFDQRIEIGDLVKITKSAGEWAEMLAGYGIYLGVGTRGEARNLYYSFFFNGRVATFDPCWWEFEVIGEH